METSSNKNQQSSARHMGALRYFQVKADTSRHLQAKSGSFRQNQGHDLRMICYGLARPVLAPELRNMSKES